MWYPAVHAEVEEGNILPASNGLAKEYLHCFPSNTCLEGKMKDERHADNKKINVYYIPSHIYYCVIRLSFTIKRNLLFIFLMTFYSKTTFSLSSEALQLTC